MSISRSILARLSRSIWLAGQFRRRVFAKRVLQAHPEIGSHVIENQLESGQEEGMITRRLSRSLLTLSVVAIVSFALPALPENPSEARVAAAKCQRCGDGYCAPSCENERTCPADCAPQTFFVARCGKCGDGRCVPQCGETAESCPADCGATEISAAATDAPDAPCEPAESKAATARSDPKKE